MVVLTQVAPKIAKKSILLALRPAFKNSTPALKMQQVERILQMHDAKLE
jgi:hypothetical protein